MPSEQNPPKVFISYSHDSQEHAARVLKLSDALCNWGIDCHIDQYELAPANWLSWMERQIKEADFVLIVCTEKYCLRFEQRETHPTGVGWEGGVITTELYQRQQDKAAKFIPIVFSREDEEHIPASLRATHRHHISIGNLDAKNPRADQSTENLYRHLAGMPRVTKPKIGRMVALLPINAQEEFEDWNIEDISNEVISQHIAESPKPKAIQLTGKNFIEDLGNGVKLEMMAIPGCSFQMGSEDFDDTKPIHPVKLSPFHIGKFQVTQAQWLTVMGSNHSHYKADNLPVENVSWYKASEFCLKLSEMTLRHYRLPTEAEWECACRAGSTGKYCFGDNIAQLEKYAWYSKNAGDKTHPVGEKPPNDWGLHDMHGNVWEWCHDCYDEDYYWESLEVNPQGPSSGVNRVLRGGSFNHRKDQCCSSSRGSYTPDTAYRYLGFRVVCSSF